MADFDFDQVVERRGSGSVKWDINSDSNMLPMWVADMDFKTAPVIVEALARRVEHGVFGYTHVADEYYAALSDWFEQRHGFAIAREWVIYTSGVVPALSAILKALTKPGDGVIVQTPAYNCFFSSIRNTGCRLIESPLRNTNGYYEMNFELLEQQASREDVTAMILCNPHNPVGRAWREDELRKVGEICFRHQVTVISDEIHCDLVFPGQHHQVFAALGEEFLQNSVTCHSPSKSFNIAGLQIANIIAANSSIRQRVDRAINVHEVCDVNPFGVTALIAAYTQGAPWLDALREYLHVNYLYVEQFLSQYLPELKLTQQQATYLAWIDCRALKTTSHQISEQLKQQAHLHICEGTLYGEFGEGYIRLNMACPRSVLHDGLERLKRVLS